MNNFKYPIPLDIVQALPFDHSFQKGSTYFSKASKPAKPLVLNAFVRAPFWSISKISVAIH
jgi:hypothetical protein